MEDFVYDTVNDLYNYLGAGALSAPHIPVDFGDAGFQYGSWLLWRYLAEHFCATNPDPAPILRTWQWADGAAGAPDMFGTQALVQVVGELGGNFRDAFAGFGANNTNPTGCYEEGAEYDALTNLPTKKRFTLGRDSDTGWRLVRLHHMTNRYIQFNPRRGARRLRVFLDLPPLGQGSEATLIVFTPTGVQFIPVALNGKGNGKAGVPFRRVHINKVMLDLTNASIRFNCFQDTVLSCFGIPLDDFRKFYYRARVK